MQEQGSFRQAESHAPPSIKMACVCGGETFPRTWCKELEGEGGVVNGGGSSTSPEREEAREASGLPEKET